MATSVCGDTGFEELALTGHQIARCPIDENRKWGPQHQDHANVPMRRDRRTFLVTVACGAANAE